jgi:hypothetical protein
MLEIQYIDQYKTYVEMSEIENYKYYNDLFFFKIYLN